MGWRRLHQRGRAAERPAPREEDDHQVPFQKIGVGGVAFIKKPESRLVYTLKTDTISFSYLSTLCQVQSRVW